MSTILKALRRLEDDSNPGGSDSAKSSDTSSASDGSIVHAGRSNSSSTLPATDPRAADELRDRILAEEAASQLGRPSQGASQRANWLIRTGLVGLLFLAVGAGAFWIAGSDARDQVEPALAAKEAVPTRAPAPAAARAPAPDRVSAETLPAPARPAAVPSALAGGAAGTGTGSGTGTTRGRSDASDWAEAPNARRERASVTLAVPVENLPMLAKRQPKPASESADTVAKTPMVASAPTTASASASANTSTSTTGGAPRSAAQSPNRANARNGDADSSAQAPMPVAAVVPTRAHAEANAARLDLDRASARADLPARESEGPTPSVAAERSPATVSAASPSPKPRATAMTTSKTTPTAPPLPTTTAPPTTTPKETAVAKVQASPVPTRTSAPTSGPKPTSSAKPKPRPIASAEPQAVERIDNRGLPDVSVVRTSWHPTSARRSAKIRVEATDQILTLREGDAIGGLIVHEISPSSVVFKVGDVEIRRRVGQP
jgi:hypothetical protein